MAHSEEHHPQTGTPPINESLIIDTVHLEAARQSREQKERDEENRKRQAQHDRLMLYVTLGLLVANLITGFAALYQAHASDISAGAAKSAAETATKTLDAMNTSGEATKVQIDRLIAQQERTANAAAENIRQAREGLAVTIEQSRATLEAGSAASRVDQRAWVGIGQLIPRPDVFKVGKPAHVNVGITVKGKTPARDIETYTYIDPAPDGSPPPFSYGARGHVFLGVLFPDNERFVVLPISAVGEDVLSAATLQSLIKGDVFLYVHGQIFYKDIFGRDHWTTFCQCVMNYEGPVNFGTCTEHNDEGDGRIPKYTPNPLTKWPPAKTPISH